MILQIQTVHICSVTSSEALWLHTDHYKDLIDLSLWRPLVFAEKLFWFFVVTWPDGGGRVEDELDLQLKFGE